MKKFIYFIAVCIIVNVSVMLCAAIDGEWGIATAIALVVAFGYDVVIDVMHLVYNDIKMKFVK